MNNMPVVNFGQSAEEELQGINDMVAWAKNSKELQAETISFILENAGKAKYMSTIAAFGRCLYDFGGVYELLKVIVKEAKKNRGYPIPPKLFLIAAVVSACADGVSGVIEPDNEEIIIFLYFQRQF